MHSLLITSPGELWVECAAELIAEGDDTSLVTETANNSWPGEMFAAALYTLNCCPIHSRYRRRGLGEHKPLSLGEFIMTPINKVRRLVLSQPAIY